jgi:flagellar basal body rod protein FlgF
MGCRSTFTEAQMRRAMKAARDVDPQAIVEVTADGTIRILPAQPQKNAADEVDKWFSGQG